MRQKHESRLSELINAARQMNIEVRTEKLLREVGYRARSGRCRVNGQELILIDRDAPISDQIDFLSTELAQGHSEKVSPRSNSDNPTKA
jgi:hypothetical protein